MVERIEYDPKFSNGNTFKNPPKISDERWAQYLRSSTVFTLDEIKTSAKRLTDNKFKESSLIQKLAGLMWYGFIEATGGLTPKRLIWILTNLDQLLPYIPDPMAQKIIMVLDKIAEELYKRI